MELDSEFDSTETALLVIDVQQGIFTRPTPVYKENNLIKNINMLIKRFARAGAPVFLIQHSNQKTLISGSRNWEFHPDLITNTAEAVIPKTHGNAFQDTRLREELDSRGINNIVITGLVTNGCVQATSIAGHELGYQVVLVEDGHSSYIKGAARLIRDWNRKLSTEYVDLHPTSIITLS